MKTRTSIKAFLCLGLVAMAAAAVAVAKTEPGARSVRSGSPKIGVSLEAFMKGKKAPGIGGSRKEAPVLVILSEQADLSASVQLQSRLERGKYVYEQLRKTALKTQTPLVELLRERGVSYQRFYIMNLLAIEGASRELILELASRPEVAKVIANPKIRANFPVTRGQRAEDPLAGPGENLKRVGADRVWQDLNVRGEGIVVAGQDTGVEWDHPALKAHYRGSAQSAGQAEVPHDYNWHDSIHKSPAGGSNKCGYDLKVPCDDNAHGTHTIGTVVGDDGKGNQIGMAPGAQWIACRNMDEGAGTPATYIECFEWFLAPYAFGADPMNDGKPEMAPHVINNSWGCPKSEGCEGSEILPVVDALKKAGVMVIASAGNDGPGCSTIMDPPAHYSEGTLSVGAFDHRTDKIAYFSSRGPSKFDGGIGPDVSAPGVSVRSCTPGGGYAGNGWSGTSMAGPHVVGQVALMWSANKGLIGEIDKTTDIIRGSAEAKTTTESCGGVAGSAIPNNTFGYGIMDTYKSVNAAVGLVTGN